MLYAIINPVPEQTGTTKASEPTISRKQEATYV